MNGVGSRDPLKARGLGGSAPAALGVLALFCKKPRKAPTPGNTFFSLNQPTSKMFQFIEKILDLKGAAPNLKLSMFEQNNQIEFRYWKNYLIL